VEHRPQLSSERVEVVQKLSRPSKDMGGLASGAAEYLMPLFAVERAGGAGEGRRSGWACWAKMLGLITR